jgi:putative nucleotidyltransferase with HDIG domain
MTESDVQSTEEFLARYFQEFACLAANQKEVLANLRMKYAHTLAVHVLTKELARGLHLDHDTVLLLRAAALLHDVGRFQQIVQHQSYSDAQSIDHAALGVTIIRERGALACADANDVTAIETAIREHNKLNLSAAVNDHTRIVAQVLRDADKIDIIRVSTEINASEIQGRKTDLFCEVSFTPVCNESVVAAFLSGEVVPIRELSTVYDEFLLYLSWINDMHYDFSVTYLARAGYLDFMMRVLPDAKIRNRVFEYVYQRIDKRCTLGSKRE